MAWTEAARAQYVAELRRFFASRLPLELALGHDEEGTFPKGVLDALYREVELHRALLPTELGGAGAGVADSAQICEVLGAADLGMATSILATFLALGPVLEGGTDRQKREWGARAESGAILAYAASEPGGGSDLTRMQTRAVPVSDGRGSGYVLRGAKQWVTNAGLAEAYVVLARTPGGPSWFLVSAGSPGLSTAKREDKHGIRLSPTAAVLFDEVFVPRVALVGEVEGLGLRQASTVFGFTRAMLAASALGAGTAALVRATRYARARSVGGAPLSDNEGYMHKLLVPNAVRLEAARAFIAHTAARVEAKEDAETEGAIAKYQTSETAKRAAGDCMQALGGYGYVRACAVEKICRDVRVTTIYEGTSEVLETVISRRRWQQYLESDGDHLRRVADHLDCAAPADCGQRAAAAALRALLRVLDACRIHKLTRHRAVTMKLGELFALVETATVFSACASPPWASSILGGPAWSAAARLFAREAVQRTVDEGATLVLGAVTECTDELLASLDPRGALPFRLGAAADMALVARGLVESVA